jgi:hypothetical protein
MHLRVVILLCRVVVVAALAVVPALFGGVANAGGPTSVLVVSPQNGNAAGLYYSDPEYDRLMTVLGGDAPGAAVTASNQQPAGYGPEYVTVTWLIHDVMIWRIDRVFLAPDPGEMWVVTQFADAEGGTAGPADGMFPGQTGGATAVWHRPADPAALSTLLADLHVTSTGAVEVVASSVAAGVSSGTGDPSGDPSGGVGSAWWAALAGLGIGVVAAIVALRALPGWQRRVLAPSTPAEVLPTMVRG